MRKDERKAEAFELYGQGLPLIDISRKLDVPEGTIRTWKRRGKWDEMKRRESETVKRCTYEKNRRTRISNL